MRDWKGRTALATGAFVLLSLAASPPADAHPRRRGPVVVRGGFLYGWSPWYGYGFGWGPYGGWGPYYPGFYPPGGVDMNAAMIAGFGAVELNVKPNRADVWVDGRYVGEARDLDGYPTYLWLSDGPHRLAIHKGGFLVFDEPIDVRRGMKTEIKLKLQPGDSPPPGTKPAPLVKENDKDKAKEKEKEKEKDENEPRDKEEEKPLRIE